MVIILKLSNTILSLATLLRRKCLFDYTNYLIELFKTTVMLFMT